MRTRLVAPHSLFLCSLIAYLLLIASNANAQKLDLNANGLSDVWENYYNFGALDPNADSDGDGVPNRLENLAGTDPLDPNSLPRLSFSSISNSQFTLSMPCELGKRYEWQSVTGFGSNWVVESSTIARAGTVVSLTLPTGANPKFFRIAVSDVDSDGDGLNDWEEYKLGLDPLNPNSNGELDQLGQPIGDFAFASARIGSQNLVSISATDPTANQPDPGQNPINSGLITISRAGFPLNSISVNLALVPAGPGVAVEGLDHAVVQRLVSLPRGVSSQTISVTPLANTNRVNPVVATMKLMPGPNYQIGIASNASVVIYPSSTPNGTGLTGAYYTNASSTYASTANFNPANLKFTRVDTNIAFLWSTSLPFPNNGYYSVRWTGQVLPQYSETYYFVANTDDGVKLWVNDKLIIDSWIAKSPSDVIGTIDLQGGIRYNIKMEYFQQAGGAGATCSWYSVSQPRQVIPASRLFPSANGPGAVTSPLSFVGFLGQPFTNSITGANSPLSFSASPLPPGLSFNPATGLLGGIPSLAGDYQIVLTSSNAISAGASVVDVQIIDTGSSITREVWSGVSGVNISDIPLNTPATVTNFLGSLEGIDNYGDNYGERIRGYLTAPATAKYTFWLAASDSAQLWISNDGEPQNKVLRASVSPNGTGIHQYNAQAKQKSSWLSLVAGQRYYVEILHKAGVGTNDNWSVGWLQDPTGTNNTPGGVVPGYLLGRHFDKPPAYIPGTLYSANMLAQPGIASSGVGTATLRLSADEATAVLNYHASGLTSAVTGRHIHTDPYLSKPSTIIFDIDEATPQPDGSFIWNISAVSPYSVDEIREIIKEGKAYINIHTANNPSGEIRGNFTAADGSPTFTPPPPPPAWLDDHGTTNGASRFLAQATFGSTLADIASVQALGFDGWLSNQFLLPATHHLPNIYARINPDPSNPYPGTTVFNTWWQNSITAPDQLRQRVAFALSELMVVSEAGVLGDNGRALADYYDTLLDYSFGNFRELLEAVTLTPAMGRYLDMLGNAKGNIATGVHANENYAREIMQLFSVGLYRMWPDGTLILDSNGELVPTYDQNVIMGFAATFTGWGYWQANQANGHLPLNFTGNANYTNPMVLVPSQHDLGTKLLLDNVVLPQAWGTQTISTNSDYDTYGQTNLEMALDNIFYNENVGPFVCRQLIQRLVTSNPSRDYVYRVVQKFNDNGFGVRGDMQAVIRAVLLDYEARSTDLLNKPGYGKLREPLLRVTAAARAFAPSAQTISGTYSQNGSMTITVNTLTPHRLTNSENLWLSFTDSSGHIVPPTQSYGVTTVNGTTFTINAPGLSSGTYSQITGTISNEVTGTIDSTNLLTVTVNGNGLVVGNQVYLAFTSGGAASGLFQIIHTNNANTFIVETSDTVTRTGNLLIPKWTGGGFTTSRNTNVTVSLIGPHGLSVGDSVLINFPAGYAPDGQYQVVTVPDAAHFTIVAPSSQNANQNGMTVYPLIAPQLVRSGTVNIQFGTYNVNYTDSGGSSSLGQTPLHSPTVFNFFFPDYKFPGAIASAGMTTPEFMLTSDTEVMFQMNFLYNGVMNNGSNTNGLCSFSSGDGDIVLDLSPWMTPGLTSNSGVPAMVDGISSLLLAGQLSPAVRTTIINYVANTANLGYSTPPTAGQMRDRVKAVVYLILVSPDFTVQK